MNHRLSFVACTLLLSACESTHVAPATGATAALEVDERRLWDRAKQESAVLDRSGFLLRDATVDRYLDGVVTRLHAPPLAEEARYTIRVLVDPTLNAFALPDGTLYVHTGLLAAVANEAQLAAVLAHEAIHATHRHQLKSQRDLKNKTAFAAAFSASTAGAGALFGVLGAAASLSGYAQNLERDADEAGFALMAAAGYDMREAPKVFRTMLEESRRNKIREPFFFGSHPRLTERMASYEQLLAQLPPPSADRRTGTEDYEAALVEAFLRNADAAQQHGATEAAIASAERALRLRPTDTRVLLLLADIRRKRDPDPAAALLLYERALEQDAQLAEAHCGLALIAFKRGDLPTAQRGFTRYLEIKPEAPDRAFVVNLLKQCSAPR